MNEKYFFYDKSAEFIKNSDSTILLVSIKPVNDTPAGAKILTDKNGLILLSEIAEFPVNTQIQIPDKCPEEQKGAFETRQIKYKAASDTYDFFVEYFNPRKRIVIFGAGHVGARLAQLTEHFDFDVILIDDRADLLNRFKSNKIKTINTDFNKIQIEIKKNDYLVIVTRGHSYDKEVLEQVIDSDAAYIGMLGSRKRIAAVKHLLTAAIVSAEKLNKVYSPIGIPLSSSDVSEIALAILAEIIAVKNNKTNILKFSSKL